MGRKLEIILSGEQKLELETTFRSSKNATLRQRCQILLLKSSGRTSKDIGLIVGIKSEYQINCWVKRYNDRYNNEGISVLGNISGQGRPRILNQADMPMVREAVEKERQRLSQAKVLIEQQKQQSFSLKTLKRFLKVISAGTNESGVE